jgi:hypothetical protein
MTQLANFVFSLSNVLPKMTEKRPKHAEVLLRDCNTFAPIRCAVTVTDTVKLSYCMEYGKH